MLSTGEWIRHKKFLGLSSNLNTNSVPVFPSGFQPFGIPAKLPSVVSNSSVGPVKNLKTTGVSRIRNVASDFTALLALRSGTYLTKSEIYNVTTNLPTNIPARTVISICGCQTGTVNKPGLCPTCRK